MDFSLDVANFFGGLGCIDEDEVTTEAIVKLSKAGLRSDEGCSCGTPALINSGVQVSELQLPTCREFDYQYNHEIIESSLKGGRVVARRVFSRVLR